MKSKQKSSEIEQDVVAADDRCAIGTTVKAAASAVIVIVLLCCEQPTRAALISLDFNTQNTVSPFEISPTMSGEEVGIEGTIFTGQSGDWNTLLVGEDLNGDTAVTNATLTFPLSTGALLAGDGTTTDVVFTFGTGATVGSPVLYTVFNGTGTGSTELRQDMIVLTNARPGPVGWQLSGLIPGKAYDLVLFGQEFNNTAFNDAGFTVFGGGPDEFDDQFDGNFLNVIASPAGLITGTVANASVNGSWSGLQIQGQFVIPIPEPSSLLLLGFGLIGLARYRRRRTAQLA